MFIEMYEPVICNKTDYRVTVPQINTFFYRIFNIKDKINILNSFLVWKCRSYVQIILGLSDNNNSNNITDIKNFLIF